MLTTMPEQLWPSWMILEYVKVFLLAFVSLIAMWVLYKVLKPLTDKGSS